MHGRLYYVPFSAVSVSVAQDLFEFTPAANKAIIPLAVVASIRDDETNQQLEFTLQRRSGAFTSGSGGGTVTPVRGNLDDATAGCTVERNNTTRASGGTQEILVAEGVPSQGGFSFLPTPEMQFQINNGEIFVVGLENAPAAAVTMSGWVAFREL